ncbi:TetR/AcrR family transcriptional regulator [Microbacterium sp. NPDC089698]|jgi:AcrR family transcriptional regulator|uniref:TetR/AcrR family transcriptional regulator n=1 Tax=unclassified Microbacterium TaxID=2609290 RepID=UPI0028229007|nr:TetR/AcrR family transcriptional regulator [Microbacterium sp.]MDR2321352.1 TetR/AcrR family transcriptional regulator [Microbacterium sp.]
MIRGSYAKGIAKRQEILEVALEVVAEMGCRNAPNVEIARRVGLTQAGLMHHFGSREELYMAVLRARDERDTEAHWVGEPNFEGFLAVIDHNTTVPGLVQLYVEFSAEASIGKHPAHEFFIERYEWVRTSTKQAVRVAQESGEFGPNVDADIVADLVIATADGLQQQWLLDRSIDMVARLRTLWNGIAILSKLPRDD